MKPARRWTFAVPLKELAGAQSSLTRADVAKGGRDARYEATLRKARLAIAEARRCVRRLAGKVMR